MTNSDRDGRFEIALNSDRTQAFLTVFPPRAAGRSVTAAEVVAELRSMGVMYGIREDEVVRAVRCAHESGAQSPRIIAAQGVMPEDGTDAQVTWCVDERAAHQPMPTRPDGLPDLFCYDPARLVVRGQALATVTPARPGSPGKSLLAPFAVIRQGAGHDCGLVAGPGVRVSDDRLHYSASVDGCVEVRQDQILVHAMQWIEGDLDTDYTATGGLVVLGSMRRGGTVRASGTVGVRGSMAGVHVRSRGDIYVSRAARCTLVADGNVYVLGSLMHCQVNCRKKLVALDGASIVGGDLLASDGVDAMDLGASNATRTVVTVGVDKIGGIRMDEIHDEIAMCEATANKIGQTVRPLAAGSVSALAPDKRELIQRLMDERRNIEERVRHLHGEKRLWTLSAKEKIVADVVVRGTAFPGVEVHVAAGTQRVDTAVCCVLFTEGSDPLHVAVRPWKETRVA